MTNESVRGGGYRPRYAKEKKHRGIWGKVLRGFVTLVASVVSLALTAQLLLPVAMASGDASAASGGDYTRWAVMDRYDTFVTHAVSDALEGIKVIKKTYWLSDDDLVAPEPNPACFGTTDDPSSLQWLLDEAERLLGVKPVVFSTDVELMTDTLVTYYLDETIFSITWKQVFHDAVYTMSEVKIAHPSQFRRFLSDGTYGSDKQYMTTQMAQSVNAVTASSGDFYKFRAWGVNVYQGQVRNVKTWVDTCYVTESGDLILSPAGTFKDVESAQKFVDENKVRFSLAFGPIMIMDGKNVVPRYYDLGEINDDYARAALCQLGELHYMLVAMNDERNHWGCTNSSNFADQLIALGVPNAYALDGGQTAAIVTNDKLINRPTYGFQRLISDIIYFATALPEDEWDDYLNVE